MNFRQTWANDPFLIGLLTTAFSLDVADMFGKTFFPNGLHYFACEDLFFIQKLLSLGSSNLSLQIAQQCQGGIFEPNISIIFFTVKIILLVIALAYFFTFVLMPKLKNKVTVAAADDGGNFNSTTLGLCLLSVFLFFKFQTAPSLFRSDFTSKIFEDFVCIVLFFSVLAITNFVIRRFTQPRGS